LSLERYFQRVGGIFGGLLLIGAESVRNQCGAVRIGAGRCEFFGRHIKAARPFALFLIVHKKRFAYEKTVLAKV
jgi:hypothetical protein